MGEDERIAYLSGDSGVRLEDTERAELDELRDLLAHPAVWAEPDPALQERVVGAVADAARTPPLRLAPRSAAASPPVLAGHRSRRIRYTILGIAAVLLLAVGIAVTANRHGSRSVEYAASLTSTALAPGASGHATLTQSTGGWHIYLNATGLPRLDNGRYYEAWLKNSSGTLVPVGTFNQPTDVTLWAGVSPSSYPTLTITRQLANGDPASSRQVVLSGTTHRIH